MTHTLPSRSPSSLEVPAFETDDSLLALLPKDIVNRGARTPGARAKDIEIVVIGENHDFSVLAAEIKSAWAQLSESRSSPPDLRLTRQGPLITYLLALAL